MPELQIEFGPGGVRDAGEHTTYIRTYWGDTWTEAKYLHCTEAAWSASPAMPTATLQKPYGELSHEDETAFSTFLKKNYQGQLVKVEFATDDPLFTRDWYGIISLDNDLMGGATIDGATATATGNQVFTAYGLEKLLSDFVILTSHIDDGGEVAIIERPPTFNRGGVKNRSTSKIDGAYVFSNDPDSAEFWSTADICEYLLRYQTPTDLAGNREFQFSLPADHVLPTWDRPVLEQEGMTTYSLLSQLADRRRLVIWNLVVSVGPPDTIEMQTRTMVSSAVTIPLPGAADIPGNDEQRHLIFDEDQMTSACLRASDVDLVHQVVVRGAQRLSIGSFAIDDSTAEKGWTSNDEETYTDGATNEPGFSSLSAKDKEERHAEARAKTELEQVYSFFRIPQGWNRKVKNGEGGAENALFPVAGTTDPAIGFYPTIHVQESLFPLVEGVDYSDSLIPDASFSLPPEGKRVPMAPLVVLKIPESDPVRWIAVDQIGKSAELEPTVPEDFRRFSASVRVPRESKGVRIEVSGAPQHVLDGLGFDYLPEDVRLGEWSFEGDGGMIMTLAVPDDRYCEGVWPATPSGVEIETLRKKLIWAGDGYRKDYVAPGTVVGVDTDGTLKRSDGGFIPADDGDDDQAKLTAAAKIAAAWYTTRHYVLCLRTKRAPSPPNIDIGDLVTQIGDENAPGTGHAKTILGPITEIKISTPLGTPESPTEAELMLTTWAGELDPLVLQPPETDLGETPEFESDIAFVDVGLAPSFAGGD